MRSRSGIQIHFLSLAGKFPGTFYYGVGFSRIRTEHLYESPRIHRRMRLALETFIAIGYVRHGRNALTVKTAHLRFQCIDTPVSVHRITQSVNLVYESGHSAALLESSPQMGKFYVAMRIHESRNNRAGKIFGDRKGRRIQFAGRTHFQHIAFIVSHHIAVPDRVADDRKNIIRCKNSHFYNKSFKWSFKIYFIVSSKTNTLSVTMCIPPRLSTDRIPMLSVKCGR